MTDGSGVSATWAIVMIIVVPAVIIVAAELDERLRQRESPLRSAVLMLRNWMLPFFAFWAVLVPILGMDQDSLVVGLAGTGLVLSVGAAVLRALRVLIDEISARPRSDGRGPVPQLLLALPRLGVIIATGWILIGSVWGVDLSAALTALGVTSLVVSFALQDTLSGLASGVLLLSDQPFQSGDWIEAGDVEGVVMDVNWRTSRIRDRNGDTIVVPNSQLAGSNIVNYSSPNPLHRVVVPVQVAYKNPPTLAKAMLMDAALSTPGVLPHPPPNVVVVQIDDPLMGYEVQMWVDDYAIGPRVKSDFGSLVWYQSYRHDVPLPSPAQDLYLWDGVATEAAGRPAIADIRQLLDRAQMLSSLGDDDLDRLAHASQPARFSIGELMLDSRAPTRDVLIILEGEGSLLIIDDSGTEVAIGELAQGEVIDLATSAPRDGRDIALRALTDCEVLIVNADVLGEVGSRNSEVADAFNRVSSIRRRRVERMTQHRVVIDQKPEDPTS
jgi:small-conductance mechanosensitive channel